MKKFILSNLFLVSALLMSCNQNNESYYPLKEGYSREYSVSTQGNFGGNNGNVKISYLEKTKIGETEVIPEMMTYPNGSMTQYIANDKDGIFIYATKDSFQSDPIISKDISYLMKNNIKEGDSWQNKNGETTKVVKTNETVIVPAGTFKNCLRLDTNSRDAEIQTWYSKGIGMVKNITITNNLFSKTNMSMELIKY